MTCSYDWWKKLFCNSLALFIILDNSEGMEKQHEVDTALGKGEGRTCSACLMVQKRPQSILYKPVNINVHWSHKLPVVSVQQYIKHWFQQISNTKGIQVFKWSYLLFCTYCAFIILKDSLPKAMFRLPKWNFTLYFYIKDNYDAWRKLNFVWVAYVQNMTSTSCSVEKGGATQVRSCKA